MNKIINFHLVNDSVWFEGMICFLKSRYDLISIETLHESYLGHIKIKNSCHITVDDGDKSFYDVIFPVLMKHNVPASIYVSPKMCTQQTNFWFQEIDGYNQMELKRIIADTINMPFSVLEKYNSDSILKTRPFYQILEIIKRYQKATNTALKAPQNMTLNDLKDVNKSGLVTIGAHTLNHPILKNEDDVNSKYEIYDSICELSNILNHEIKYFAYPNGKPTLDFTEREMDYLKNAGINLTFTTEAKNISSNNDPMRIPRICISNSESMSFFKTKLFIGSFWNTLRKLKPTGEYRERKELNLIISSANGA